MTTPKQALEGLIEAVTRDADEPGGRGISGYTSARLSDAKAALASLQGEDAVERVAGCICQNQHRRGYCTEPGCPYSTSGAVEKVKALAHRFWSIHPSTIAAMNLTREEFYVREMMALLATGLVPDEAAIRAEPTLAQINSACLSFRHDFGLLDATERGELQWQATEWLRAWQKEGFGCDRDEVIERCAAVVDQCNREGPYEAIASAKRIRALKSAAIRSGGAK